MDADAEGAEATNAEDAEATNAEDEVEELLPAGGETAAPVPADTLESALVASLDERLQQMMKTLDGLKDSQMVKTILGRSEREGWSQQRLFDEMSKLLQLLSVDTNAAPAGGETAAPAPAKEETSNPTVAPWETW